MAELVEYIDKAGGKAIADGAKAYANKVSKVTITKETTPDEGMKATYSFSQNGTVLGKVNVPLDKVVENAEIVVASETNEIVDPTSTNDPKDNLAYGTYLKLTIANVEDPLYVEVGDTSDMTPVTSPTILAWFKDVSTITLNDSVVVTTINGEVPEIDQVYYTGDELVVTAPTTDASSKALVSVTVNGVAVATNTADGTATYQLSDYDYQVSIGATYED